MSIEKPSDIELVITHTWFYCALYPCAPFNAEHWNSFAKLLLSG